MRLSDDWRPGEQEAEQEKRKSTGRLGDHPPTPVNLSGYKNTLRAGSCRSVIKPLLQEPHLHIRPFFQMDALYETDLPGAQSHDHRRCARAFAKKADAFHQRAVGHAGGGEDELFAWSKIFGFVNALS